MMKLRKMITILTLCAGLAACQSQPIVDNTANETSNSENTVISQSSFMEKIDWKNETVTSVDLSEGSYLIESSGIYVFTGTLEQGMIEVNVDKTVDEGSVYLILNDVSISSSDSPAIWIKEAEEVMIQLEEGTVNTLNQGAISTSDVDFPSAALFSKTDLTISGTGELIVNTLYNDGISSRDDLVIYETKLTVDALMDGIVGKDSLTIHDSEIEVTAGKDALRSTDTEANTGWVEVSDSILNLISGNDGLQAESDLTIQSGTFTIVSGGGYPGRTQDESSVESMKALKAVGELTVNGGSFDLSSYDDALHSNSNITINGGTFLIETGDDGIHADGELTINDGIITILNSYEGIEGADITINGGTISITSSDDGINVNSSNGVMTFNGGDITIAAQGDGIDSNFNIVQTGGTITIDTALTGRADTPVDYDGSFTQTGGKIVDQNGNEIDTAMMMGGPGGQGMPGQNQNQNRPGMRP